MALSVFDLFSIGIGPSSSHTVGPMIAGLTFFKNLQSTGELLQVESMTVELFGSLALTGHGHETDKAILLGIMGESPISVDLDKIPEKIKRIKRKKKKSSFLELKR